MRHDIKYGYLSNCFKTFKEIFIQILTNEITKNKSKIKISIFVRKKTEI